MPRDLSTGGVNNNYDRAACVIVVWIAAEFSRNTRAVLAREIGRAKHLAIAVWLKATVVDDREIIALIALALRQW